MNLATRGTQKIFLIKCHKDLCIELGNHYVYSHHFINAYFHIYWPFLVITQIHQFLCVLAHRSNVWEHPTFFVKKLHEDLHIELGTTTYTQTIFNAHFRIYKLFFRIT
uniref:Putative ovule protein n=1 Tax=Solanum chacoense TaxID=4108 RepID=A0A0V0GQS0_SOLCH